MNQILILRQHQQGGTEVNLRNGQKYGIKIMLLQENNDILIRDDTPGVDVLLLRCITGTDCQSFMIISNLHNPHSNTFGVGGLLSTYVVGIDSLESNLKMCRLINFDLKFSIVDSELIPITRLHELQYLPGGQRRDSFRDNLYANDLLCFMVTDLLSFLLHLLWTAI